ncbi:MAG TPA: ferritin-like domain-containing protein [Longimicrobiaceae bacterium]|nr:ferritin-like domain-containing protein [Longimicrobiaceae bacterium]
MPHDQTEAQLVAELNDLIRLDHDAVGAYTLAIAKLENEEYRASLREFRGDHERHIQELSALVRARGSEPAGAPHPPPPGFFKPAIQALGALGGDRAVLLAFKSNEGQVRDKYRRHADRPHPGDVEPVLRRAALDEERHYAWVEQVLEALGAGPGTVLGTLEKGLEAVHGRISDVEEALLRKVAERKEEARRGGAA